MTDIARKPRLQLAVDVLDVPAALALLEQVHPFIDIVEVGTPLILEEGLGALAALKKACPGKCYLADAKIMDAGYIEAGSAFRRGADIVTVLGVADDATIRGVLKAAKEHGKTVMADLIQCADVVARARQLQALGVPILCLHTAFDLQASGVDPLAELRAVRPAVTCEVAVAGGLRLETVGPALELGADIVVVGGGIASQPDPRAAAAAIAAKLQAQRV